MFKIFKNSKLLDIVSRFVLRASNLKNSSQSGQIIIIAAVFMLVVLTLIVGLVGYAGVQIKGQRQAVGRVQALNLAEGGIEKAIWKLNNTAGYTGETGTVLGAGTYNITITDIDPVTKLIRADAFIPNASNPTAKRTVQVTTKIGALVVNFGYGLHAGEGGIDMDNNSTVNGSAYSNANIEGGNGALITGNATAAGGSGKIDNVTVSGTAYAHFIEDATVGANANGYDFYRSTATGSVSAHSIRNCTVTGNATYNTKTVCTVLGTQTTPNPSVPADPADIPLPITEAQIDDWETQATNGGVVGSQTISGTVSLGPKKINGDLITANNSVLNVTGTLWVTGELRTGNNTTIKLDPGFGSLSGVIVVGTDESSTNGYVDIINGTTVTGSGVLGSYLMVLSQREGTGSDAIRAANQSVSGIYYAGEGKLEVVNTGSLVGATAELIHLNQNAIVTYDPNLANTLFSSGLSTMWEISDGTWQLLQ